MNAIFLTLACIIAITSILNTNLFHVAILNGLFSLLIVGFYVSSGALDVALTEIVISCGIANIFLLTTISIVGSRDNTKNYILYPVISALLLLLILIIYFVIDVFYFLGNEGPAYLGIADYYLNNTKLDIHIPNVVTAILASYRGYDTMGETIVIFTAGSGIYLLLKDLNLNHNNPTKHLICNDEFYHIIMNIIMIIFPLIILYTAVIQLQGDYSIGGGFQSGVIFANAIIFYNLLTNHQFLCCHKKICILMGIGMLIYVLLGIFCILLGGSFLDYKVLHSIQHYGQHIGIFLAEISIAITVATSMIAISNMMIMHTLNKKESIYE